MPSRTAVAIFCVGVLAPWGCGAPPEASRTTTRGDTTFIVVAGERGPWGPPHPASELLRVTGSQPDSGFGQLDALVALPSGGVVVFDSRGPRGSELQEFDSSGRFVRVLGRAGSGPSEYATTIVQLTSASDGTILLFDPMSHRIVRFRDGEARSTFRVPQELVSGRSGTAVVAMHDGSVVTNNSFRAARESGERSFVRFDSTGAIRESFPIKTYWPELSQTYGEFETAVPLRDGPLLVFRSDVVGFLISDPRRSEVLSVRVIASAPAYHAAERDELQAIEEWAYGGAAASAKGLAPKRVPRHKPLARGAFEDIDGRIWVVRSAVGERIEPEAKYWGSGGTVMVSWTDPPRLVAFSRVGGYLGEVTFPPLAKVAPVGDHAWAILPDSNDFPVLIKYRIAPQ